MAEGNKKAAAQRSWRITGALILDPFTGREGQGTVWVEAGRVVERPSGAFPEETVEASGLWLIPRLTDIHVHFRSPGQEWKEDLRSGSMAAAAGGFTVVATMPNTDPVVDIPALVAWQRLEAERLGLVRVWPIGAISVGLQGKALADLWGMQEAGAVGFSDDGRPVADSRLMRAALSYSRSLTGPIIQHAEDPGLFAGASMHEGSVSHRMGIPGAPAEAESVMVWRDVQLAALTGGRLHIAHLSAPGSLEALAWAKRRGLQVTAEATPHHLLLTDEAVAEWGYDAVTKVNPPLRPAAMREALVEAVREGLVEVIASDHAPHHADEKGRPYTEAPFGISGLETSLGAVLTALVHSGMLSPLEAMRRMTAFPHRLLGQAYPGLVPGAPADLTLVDPFHEWTVDPGRFYSKGKNTPLAGARLRGRAVATMVDGCWVMREGEVIDPCADN